MSVGIGWHRANTLGTRFVTYGRVMAYPCPHHLHSEAVAGRNDKFIIGEAAAEVGAHSRR